jgi:hypothetical protein
MKKGTEIETWEDICKLLNIDPITSIAWVEHLEEEDRAPQLGLFRCTKLSQALNNGIDPYAIRHADKYYPRFNMYDSNDPSGFGFSGVDGGWTRSDAYVGARLSYNDPNLATHAGTKFTSWYRDWMVIPKK